MRTLRNKKCLVTGAGSGIGRQIALRLAEQGGHLFLLDVDDVSLAETVRLVSERGVQVIGRACDVSRPEANDAALDELLERWHTLDVLVNNAGVCYYGPTTDMTRDQLNKLLAVNLHAPLQFTMRLLPVLLGRPEAHVLNVSSMYGLFVTNRCLAYHTSKFGLVGFSEALRMEYARLGIGVTTLCPGFVRTGLLNSMVDPQTGSERRMPPRWACTTAEHVSRKAIRAIYRDQRLVLVSPLAHLAYLSRRIAPGWMDRMHRFGLRKKIRAKTRAHLRLHGENSASRRAA